MPTYKCKVLTRQGNIIKTKIDDASKMNCIKKLKRNGMYPIKITQTVSLGRARLNEKNSKKPVVAKKKDLLNTAKVIEKSKNNDSIIAKLDKALAATERITSRDIRIFTQNFYLLKKANFNNVHALSTVIEATENPKLKLILQEILSGVESGDFMYTTMEYYSSVFPFIYINMIKVGELSGSLDLSLEQAVKYLDDTDALNRKLRSILIPNIAMFVGILVMLFAGVIVGLPMLQGLFDQIGSTEQLPAITIWFAGVVDKLIAYWYIPVGIVGGITALFVYYINTSRGRYNFDYFKYKMPIFGKLIYSIDFTRLMKNMVLNLKNGMRIQDSLEVSKNVAKNTVMRSLIETSINNLFIGQSWIEPFEKAGFGSTMAIEMLKIGMQTDLTEMMEKLLVYMEVEIDNTLQKVIKVLPEVSYLFVGIVLIFFVLVVLVPCIQVYMGGWLFSAYGV